MFEIPHLWTWMPSLTCPCLGLSCGSRSPDLTLPQSSAEHAAMVRRLLGRTGARPFTFFVTCCLRVNSGYGSRSPSKTLRSRRTWMRPLRTNPEESPGTGTLSSWVRVWASKCTTMVCLSTAEAEFVAATEAAKDVVWLRGLLSELGFSLAAPSVLLEDNQACVSMIRNNSVSDRNRHFAVKMAWLRDKVSSKVLSFVFVPSKNNCADIFTKVLPDAQFRLLSARLMLGVQTWGGVSK